MDYLNTIIALSLLVLKIAFAYMVFYLDYVNCQCSNMWQRTYLQYFIFIVFALSLLNDNLLAHGLMDKVRKTLGLVLIIALVIYVYAGYKFIQKLEEEKCRCAVERKPYLFMMAKVWNWLLVLYILVIPVSLLLITSFLELTN